MKKIMFNDKYGLNKAVLDGRKTQARRIVKFNAVDGVYAENDLFPISNNRVEPYVIKKYSIYNIGEVVAIAQSYKDCGYQPTDKTIIVRGSNLEFIEFQEHNGWNNKMFVKPLLMPHQIKITNVRIERLQDINDDDCLKEGILKEKTYYGEDSYNIKIKDKKHYYSFDNPREAYAALIDKVSGKGTWDSNPYVFVYDFELVK